MNNGSATQPMEARILSLCPSRADALIMRRLLGSVGMPFDVFEETAEFCAALSPKAGVLLFSEEALLGPAGECVQELLSNQEDWSSIPLIVLGGGTLKGPAAEALPALEAKGRVTFVDRPVRLAVLAAVVRMAVADRLQQFRVRDLLAERAEAIARRDAFLAMLGHELRNPLGAASLCAEILAQAPDGPKAEECTQILLTQVSDMKRLLDDLLDVSRLTRDRLELRCKPMELGRVLREAVMQVRHEIEDHRQRLDVQLPADEVLMHGDATRLRQVFANLLGNATRYSPADTEITLSAEREGNGVRVCIRDQGYGMTREHLDRVFEPFWQGADSGGHGGLGIGLTLAHRLVEMHEGRLEAYSDGEGLGSELRVFLPLSESPRTAPASRERSADAHGLRVVVIDDNRDFALGIQHLLSRKGYQVELAGNGAEGITAAERQRPDVILLDIGLPDMDGFAVASRLRSLPGLHGVRIIGMSGFGSPEHQRRSRETGLECYLTKPVSAATLAKAIAADS